MSGIHNKTEQMTFNDHNTANFFWKISSLTQTRVILMSYPDHVLNAKYSFVKLKPFLQEYNVRHDVFMSAHKNLSKATYVHTFHNNNIRH